MGTRADSKRDNKETALGWARKDASARDCLVIDHLPLVHRLCRRFRSSGEPLEDLVQVGNLGLVKAAEKYDAGRGTAFAAFAVPVIVGEIKNYFRDHGWSVRIPRKLQKQKILVDKTADQLVQSLGRSPTVQEIAGATELTDEQVYDTFEVAMCGKPLSLDTEHLNASNDSTTLLDYLGSEDPQFDRVDDRLRLTSSLHQLAPRERAIIDLRFYSGLSQTQIAQRLGISQMHVSRLQRAALSKLRVSLEA